MLKKALWILVGIVCVIGIAGIVRYSYDNREQERIWGKYQAGGEKALTAQEFARLSGILPRKYARDTYGSTTPEGTLALFVEALKKGDADLASKYFIPEKQKEIVNDIQEINKNNRLGIVISDMESYDRKSCNEKMQECTLSKYHEDVRAESLASFIFNSRTNVWKLKSW